MMPGMSLDLTTEDENGRPWDFDCVHMRNKATRKLLEDKPLLLIGSPMCAPFSPLQTFNKKHWTAEEEESRKRQDMEDYKQAFWEKYEIDLSLRWKVMQVDKRKCTKC